MAGIAGISYVEVAGAILKAAEARIFQHKDEKVIQDTNETPGESE